MTWRLERFSGDEIAVDEAGALVGVGQEDADAVAQALEDFTAGLLDQGESWEI
jgi:hypothetical protein